MKISAAIITLNAAADIERCLKALDFCDEIVVLDQHSEDETVEICRRYQVNLHQSEWLGFGRLKQRAVELCRNRWILSVDADEEVTPELRDAILALPEQPGEAAFAVNRLSCFLGHWIRHCGWHPEYVVRLFDRERAVFNDKPVHEGLETTGKVRRLPGLLRHYTYETMEQYIAKLNHYTTLAAEEKFSDGRRSSMTEAVLRSQATFWRMWILQGGFLDGWAGTVLCIASSFSVLSKYTKIWRMGRS